MRLLQLPLCGLVAALLSTGPAQAAVLRVGPTQTFTTIQAAIDAASPGDLIIVDPGSYPAFSIAGTRLSIVPQGTEFTVVQSAGAPAIAVHDVSAPDVVSILGARIDYADPTAPAVSVTDNTGAVRFSALNVRLVAALPNATLEAAVEVADTDTFWLIDSDVWTGTPRFANTVNPVGPNDGVCALRMLDSDGVVQNSKLLGYDNETYAGDALRVRGNTSVWMVDDYYQSPTATILRGGNGGTHGGNALHLVGDPSGMNRNTICGRVKLQPGTGSVQNGGPYAINNDGGIVSGGQRLPRICGNYPGQLAETAETSAESPTVQPGGAIRVRVWTVLACNFATVLSDSTLYSRSVPGFSNRGMLDPAAPLFQTVQTGTTAPKTATVFDVPVPDLAGLIGWQLTLQSSVEPAGGTRDALSFPALVVVTP